MEGIHTYNLEKKNYTNQKFEFYSYNLEKNFIYVMYKNMFTPSAFVISKRITAIKSLIEYNPIEKPEFFLNDFVEGNLKYRKQVNEKLSQVYTDDTAKWKHNDFHIYIE
tara:strand:- start:90 stop:416 length:327 start_codon:yes stop_codon:yes gene_type:complete